ncbi:hypothetical protein OG874_05120 [Nocardia sp. NBC_00565]|uniref:hypothetical protein n=1 Tax=Nocardia sp. NBC_00565 TaxID=2975993 RepID=UPI002E7FE71A|nr:hypothetical protein [Nocardia sp. NBC_00565]WUC04575.1 hypothetical protein OG874_05120 [Nocardia sp. NBC_00565]
MPAIDHSTVPPDSRATAIRPARANGADLEQERPKAVGFVRGDVSGLQAPRHATAVQRHASALGYHYVYTIRPPQDAGDAIGYAIGIAAGLDVAAIVVYDLDQVDNQPARVCEDFDLETVCPATTWARVARPVSVETGAA